MCGQRRGEDTRLRILEAACQVFAEKGFRDATHAEICRVAQTNVAAINYYFGSKEALYHEVFKHLAHQADEMYPLDGGIPNDRPPEDRLRAFIHAHLRRLFDPERMGFLHRIRMAEMFDSTGILTAHMDAQLRRDRTIILKILREMMGPGATQRDLEWNEMSVIGQCFLMAPRPGDEGPRKLFKITDGEISHLAEHIATFSLAGIKATAAKTAVCEKARHGGKPSAKKSGHKQ